ncbi:MAG: ImmA/IrrE family metallo-endopeptidase [Bacteroidales bacterium]|nr:ImmA/IrrE family metallo-endopeptidase [Bacteroidales bacterium]
MSYEKLLKKASHHGVDIYEKPMKPRIKGLYADSVIWINKHIPTAAEKTCTLAEELGHHYTSIGDILDQSRIENRKQECRARAWAYQRLVGPEKLIAAFECGVRNRYELAEFLNVTEEFIGGAIKYFKQKHGLHYKLGNYCITFEPLAVLKISSKGGEF